MTQYIIFTFPAFLTHNKEFSNAYMMTKIWISYSIVSSCSILFSEKAQIFKVWKHLIRDFEVMESGVNMNNLEKITAIRIEIKAGLRRQC